MRGDLRHRGLGRGNCFHYPPGNGVLSVNLPCCTVGSLRSHGESEYGDSLSSALCCSEPQRTAAWLKMVSSRPRAPGHWLLRVVSSLFCLDAFPRCCSWHQETCFHLERTWPHPQHQCCSREAGPCLTGGMWGGIISVSHLVNKEVWLGFQRGDDSEESTEQVPWLLTFCLPACLHSVIH